MRWHWCFQLPLFTCIQHNQCDYMLKLSGWPCQDHQTSSLTSYICVHVSILLSLNYIFIAYFPERGVTISQNLYCSSNVRKNCRWHLFLKQMFLWGCLTFLAVVSLHRSLLGLSAPPCFNYAFSTHTVLSVLIETVIKQ